MNYEFLYIIIVSFPSTSSSHVILFKLIYAVYWPTKLCTQLILLANLLVFFSDLFDERKPAL